MITKAEILNTAQRRSVRSGVVEKDYVLGWLLASISAHDVIGDQWVFKGGTCLKKCYFETYRFSEDLDFTILKPEHLDHSFLARVLGELSAWVYEHSGLELPTEQHQIDLFPNKRGNLSCQVKVSYRGPISPRGRTNLPRIKLDLTFDEHIVLSPAKRPVVHPYSDADHAEFEILAYRYEEVFGEKVRALVERSRPRDLYDVVNLFRNREQSCCHKTLSMVIRAKCNFKNIPFPTIEAVLLSRDELERSWEPMLAHQLPHLPSLESFLNELPRFFAWLSRLSTTAQYSQLPRINSDASHFVSSDVTRQLNLVQFAASNHMCVDLEYAKESGVRSIRRIEPYSLRKSGKGNVLLFAVRRDNGETRSYALNRIQNVTITDDFFAPRYEIELATNDSFVAPPLKRSRRR